MYLIFSFTDIIDLSTPPKPKYIYQDTPGSNPTLKGLSCGYNKTVPYHWLHTKYYYKWLNIYIFNIHLEVLGLFNNKINIR